MRTNVRCGETRVWDASSVYCYATYFLGWSFIVTWPTYTTLSCMFHAYMYEVLKRSNVLSKQSATRETLCVGNQYVQSSISHHPMISHSHDPLLMDSRLLHDTRMRQNDLMYIGTHTVNEAWETVAREHVDLSCAVGIFSDIVDLWLTSLSV